MRGPDGTERSPNGGAGGVTHGLTDGVADEAAAKDAKESQSPQASGAAREDGEAWGALDVRRLRGYLGESQAGLAARLGTRQQTVSEWETGARRPRRMSRRLLRLVAEESGYYSAAAQLPATGDGSDAGSTRDGGTAADDAP